MANTPKTAKVKVDFDHPAIKAALKEAEGVGFNIGLDQGRREVIDWLEKCYITAPDKPARGSVKAEAMLELAREAGDHVRKLLKNKKGYRR